MTNRSQTRPHTSALRAAALYVGLAAIWIVASDQVLQHLARDYGGFVGLQTYKGWFFVAVTGVVLYLVLLARFRVQAKAEQQHDRLQQELWQAQKIEAVAILAGGVAHDFNNFLMVIFGYCDLALANLPAEDQVRGYLEQIRATGKRSAGLIEQLLAFSRRQLMQPQVINLNELVRELEKMLGRLLGEHVELVTRLDPTVSSVQADPCQIDQVIMNLALNARDAMAGGGTLTIETSNAELDQSYTSEYPAVQPGHYVCISVSDTGHGMDAEALARCFEPFFTTKAPGRGTGLGLSSVHGIVTQSGGHVTAYSEPETGSTFKVYLPRAGEHITAGTSEGAEPEMRGSETVLVVEDDATVLELVRHSLASYGYTVLEALTTEHALRICREREQAIHLILTDLIMPDMGGRELAAFLRAIRPGTKVVFMSGYTDEAVVHHGMLEPGTPFLQKPFSPAVLARKLRAVLDEHPHQKPVAEATAPVSFGPHRVGTCLVRRGFLAPGQLEDVLLRQQDGDPRRFGEIAVKLGYVTDAQLRKCLVTTSESTNAERIGQALVRLGVMTDDRVSEVLSRQQRGDSRLFGMIAVELGYVNEESLGRYLDETYGLVFARCPRCGYGTRVQHHGEDPRPAKGQRIDILRGAVRLDGKPILACVNDCGAMEVLDR